MMWEALPVLDMLETGAFTTAGFTVEILEGW